MKLTESLEMLYERIKFPFYASKEVELQQSEDSSQVTRPENVEHSTLAFDPFGGMTNNQVGLHNSVMSANRNEMLRRWREISYLPEVSLAINKITNEAVVYDEIDDPVSLNLNDVDLPDTIKDEMNKSFSRILYMLDFSEKGDELFKQWYVDGALHVEAVYDNNRIRDGIKHLILLSPFNFMSYIDPVTKEKRYFYTKSTGAGVSQNAVPKTQDEIYSEEQVTSINSGEWSIDKKYALSHLNPAVKLVNQLNCIEDTLIIHRITKSTEKRLFKIPVGNLPKSKAEEYMRSLIMKYRQKKVYNTDIGTIENKNRAISIMEDFWFPVDKNGVGPSVENVSGVNQNFGSFEDVDYFVNKLYKALHIPLNRRSSDSRQQMTNQIDIEKEELEFFKFILKLRRKFNNLFVDLLKKDLLARNILDLQDWQIIQEKIKFVYANSNEYSEIKKNQIYSMRVDTANAAMPLIDGDVLSVEYIQENILRLSPEEMQKIKDQNAARRAAGGGNDAGGEGDFSAPMGGGGGGPISGGGFEPEAGGAEGAPEVPAPEGPAGSAAPIPQATTGQP